MPSITIVCLIFVVRSHLCSALLPSSDEIGPQGNYCLRGLLFRVKFYSLIICFSFLQLFDWESYYFPTMQTHPFILQDLGIPFIFLETTIEFSN